MMKVLSALIILVFSLNISAAEHNFPAEIIGYDDVLNAGKIIVIGEYAGKLEQAQALAMAKSNASDRLKQSVNDFPVTRLRTVEDMILFDGTMSAVRDSVLKSAVSCGGKGYYDKEELAAYFCLTADIKDFEAFTAKYAAEPPKKVSNAASHYDSVIINTAGLPFIPAYLNKIYSADGTEIWNRRQGAPVYAHAAADAFNLLFLDGKKSPLALDAVRVDDYTDVYIDPTGTEELKELVKSGNSFRLIFTFFK